MAIRIRTRCRFPWPPIGSLRFPHRGRLGPRLWVGISVLPVHRLGAATRLCATQSAAVALASRLRPRRSAVRRGQPANVGLLGRYATPMAIRIRTRCRFRLRPIRRLRFPHRGRLGPRLWVGISVLPVHRLGAATRLCATQSAAVALASRLRPRRSAVRRGRLANVGLLGRYATPMATPPRTRCN